MQDWEILDWKHYQKSSQKTHHQELQYFSGKKTNYKVPFSFREDIFWFVLLLNLIKNTNSNHIRYLHYAFRWYFLDFLRRVIPFNQFFIKVSFLYFIKHFYEMEFQPDIPIHKADLLNKFKSSREHQQSNKIENSEPKTEYGQVSKISDGYRR